MLPEGEDLRSRLHDESSLEGDTVRAGGWWSSKARRVGAQELRGKGVGMSTKVAINGLGRIGRALLKLVVEEPAFELVAVNDLVEVDNLAYLLRFDTVYGRFSKSVGIE